MKKQIQKLQSQLEIQNVLKTNLGQLRKVESILFDEKGKYVVEKIALKLDSLNDELKIFEWRNSFQKGIVKCQWNGIFPNDKNVELETKRKYFPFSLANLGKLSLSQLLFILREILISFEIIFTKFGGFKVEESMINFDQDFNVQVWGNKQLSSNNFQLNDQNEHQFVCSILKLLEKHLIKSNLTEKFYEGLQRYENINFQTIKKYIESFIKIQNILVPNQNCLMKQFFTIDKKLMFSKESKNVKRGNARKNTRSTQKLRVNLNSKQNKRLSVGADFRQKRDCLLAFSPSKKPKRKNESYLKQMTEKYLKESDLSTEESQHLKKYSASKLINKDNKKYLIENNSVLNTQYLSSTPNSSIDISEKQLQNQKIKKPFYHDYLSKQDRQKMLADTDIFLPEPKSYIFQLIEKEQQITDRLQNNWTNYGCRMTCSIIKQQSYQEKEQLNQNIQNITQFKQLGYQKQTQKSNPPQILQFRQPKKHINFFKSIDDIAECKQMKNSVKIGPQIHKQPPVVLQKLGKLKLKMIESIIQP